MDGVEVAEVADGVHRMALPSASTGVPTVSAYLLRGDRAAGQGDTLVDCGIAAGVDGGDPGPDGTAAVPLPACRRGELARTGWSGSS
jgi:hypothetical protein